MRLLVKTKTSKLHAYTRRASLLLVVAVLVVAGVQHLQRRDIAQALTTDELRAQSAALSQQITDNNAQARALASQADTLENKLAELNIQINQANTQIELTNVKIQQLEDELVRTQAELDRQKGLLKESMRALYKKGGVSSLELLVASDSFSQFMDEQTYLEKLKESIQESAQQVIVLKAQIQQQQEEQKGLLTQQEAQRTVLQTAQTEQANLLAYTQGEEARYKQRVSELRAQQLEVNRQLAAQLRLFTGDGRNGGYPTVWANAPLDSMIDDWGMYNRECVSYTAYKVHEDYVLGRKSRDMPYWGGVGNANQWPSNARAAGYAVDDQPRVGDIAITYNGVFGHAMYVEEVLPGRQVYISQYNFTPGAYSEMQLSADSSVLGKMTFIHFP